MVARRSFDQSGLLHAIQPQTQPSTVLEEKKVITLLHYSSSVICGLLLVLLSTFARALPLARSRRFVTLNDQTVKGGAPSEFTLLFFFLELSSTRGTGGCRKHVARARAMA
jgi:hypothetical protein